MLILRDRMQGQRLLTYGGERAVAPQARPEGGDDDEDDTETVGDASLLDADARCWAPVTLAGTRARGTEHSSLFNCEARCWAPVTLAGMWAQHRARYLIYRDSALLGACHAGRSVRELSRALLSVRLGCVRDRGRVPCMRPEATLLPDLLPPMQTPMQAVSSKSERRHGSTYESASSCLRSMAVCQCMILTSAPKRNNLAGEGGTSRLLCMT